MTGDVLKLVTLFSLLFMASIAHADPAIYRHSDDTLQKLYSELHYLNKVGHEIHEKYDLSQDKSQLKACQEEYDYIGSRARATIGIANRIESPNKEEYIATGWKAYGCIKCTGDVNNCDAVPPTLETIKAEFKQMRAKNK